MLGILLVSHGKFAKELLNSAEMIMGPQNKIVALALEPDDDPMWLSEIIKVSIKKVRGDKGVIVLVDLMGGSPSNAAAYIAKEGIPVITGMNLPMLLELISVRDNPDQEMVDKIIETGKNGIIDIRKFFKEGNK